MSMVVRPPFSESLQEKFYAFCIEELGLTVLETERQELLFLRGQRTKMIHECEAFLDSLQNIGINIP